MEPTRDRRSPMLLAAIALFPLAGSQGREAPLAIVHVNVIPMDEEVVLEDRTVLVERGRVTAIVPGEEARVPRGAQIVDGSGRFLLPGLFDTHVHLNDEEDDRHLALYVANGVTTVQSMHGSPRHLDLRRRVESGEVFGPRILTTGPTTAREGVDSPEKAERVVREQKAAGYDAIKMYGDGADSMTRETYARVVSAAREAGMRVVGHAPRNLPFSVVLEEGQDSIDHMEEIVYTHEPIVEAFGPLLDVQFGRVPPEQAQEALAKLGDLRPHLAPAIRALAESAREAGLAVTPTLVAFATIWKQTTPAYERFLEIEERKYVSPLTWDRWGPDSNRYRRTWANRLESAEATLRRSLEVQKEIVRAFHEAGVPILAGTDAPLTFVIPGFSLHGELALLVESGLRPWDALRAATAVPAEELGLGAEAGTIAVGKRADLVLLEASPLEDVANTRRIAGVVRRGHWIEKAELDRRLEEFARSYEPLARDLPGVLRPLREGDAAAALAAFRSIGAASPALATYVETEVNELGYRLLAEEKVEEAIRVFTLNVEAFPEAFNPWDSLAEAYMLQGKDDLATRHYRKSLELNPDNANATEMLERIRARASEKKP